MTIFEKLRAARLELQRANIKKSGKNDYTGFSYYELSDFLPHINELSEKYGFICLITFTKEMAVLEICDTGPFNEGEIPQKIMFTSPMEAVSIKGSHPIQNLGAVQTYERRYLYMTAFEIVEHDIVDPIIGKKNEEKNGQDDFMFIQERRVLLNAIKEELEKIKDPVKKDVIKNQCLVIPKSSVGNNELRNILLELTNERMNVQDKMILCLPKVEENYDNIPF